jgi:hypothetical protein
MKDTLKVQHATALPLREISALTTRTGLSGELQLLAVGDEDFAVIQATFDDDGLPADTFRYDLFLPLVGTGIDLRGGSGFEGIACDRDEVFVLQEEASRILVFDAELKSLRHVITLRVPEHTPVIGSEWYTETGREYGAEGLLLLAGGHLLVAKQKEPVCLIEFGPATAQAGGIRPKTILRPNDRFERAGGLTSELLPLAVWELGDTAAKSLTTLNDIASAKDEHVYLISSHGKAIARLEKKLEPGEKAEPKACWALDDRIPGGEKAKPEGLALLPAITPVVGFDSKRAGDNLVILERIG